MKPDTLKVWALSLHTCSTVEAALDEMLGDSRVVVVVVVVEYLYSASRSASNALETRTVDIRKKRRHG